MKSTNEKFIVQEVQLIYRPTFRISKRPVITCSKDIYNILLETWDMDRIQLLEQFKVLLFNRSNRLLGIHEVSSGGITETVADHRLIFAAALKATATAIVLAHNHPSGNLMASENDILLTKRFKEAAKLLEIVLIDHIIISSEGYLSMTYEGLI